MPPYRRPAPSRRGPAGTLRRTFSSFSARNYRLYFAGDLVSHTGSWAQSMAEAWLVLELTDSPVAVGTTFACRFAPVFCFGLWGGTITDRFDRRRILLVTQALSALLALTLGLIVRTGVVEVWMVYAFAAALGLVTVVDEPSRNAFVEEMVGPEQMPNAVALNGAVMNSARISGPAAAALLIPTIGLSAVFIVNSLTFLGMIAALLAMRTAELRPPHRQDRPRVREGLRYAWSVPQIRLTMIIVGVVGTLVFNFPTFLTIIARETFDGGSSLAGLLMAVLGAGTVIGALRAAHAANPTRRSVLGSAALLGTSLVVAAAAPNVVLFQIALVPVGALAVFFGTTANAHMQLWSGTHIRGRVMAIFTLLTMGSTVIGGPLVGWLCQQWTPRIGFGGVGVATLLATACLVAPAMRAAVSPVGSEPTPALGD
ncbi:MAG: MFS transporter [Actinomycetota bacterium]